MRITETKKGGKNVSVSWEIVLLVIFQIEIRDI